MSNRSNHGDGAPAGSRSHQANRSPNKRRSSSNATAADESRPARLKILDKEVQISCQPGEEDDLLQAAAYIDHSMRELRQRNSTSSIEKIAIVAAINTANAMLKSRAREASRPATTLAGDDKDIIERLSTLNTRLDSLLADQPIDAPTETLPDSNTGFRQPPTPEKRNASSAQAVKGAKTEASQTANSTTKTSPGSE